MSRTIRQKLGPVKKRVKGQVEEAKLLIKSTEEEPVETRIENLTKIYSKLQKNLETLKSLENEYTETAKSDKEEAKKLDEDIEELTEFVLDADETLATIEEFKESQKHLEERELQKNKLAQEKEIEIKKLNDIREIEKEKLEIEKAKLSQQREFELERLNKAMEAREKEKLYQLDIEKKNLKRKKTSRKKNWNWKK